MKRTLALALCSSLAALGLAANGNDETVDWQMMTRIRDEGFTNSKVMQTLSQLTDVLGPRLTGSPGMKAANEWTRKQLEEWGLVNAHLESWGEFGRGWSYSRAVVHMLQPSAAPLIAYPKAWTPGTDGAVKAKVVKAKLENDADLDQWRGKLAGTIVMLGEPRELKPPDKVAFTRHGEKELEALTLFEIPAQRPQGRPGQPATRQEAQRRQRFQRTLREFLSAEKAVATIEGSRGDAGILFVGGGGSRQKGETTGPLGLVMAAEHFNRIARLIELKKDVELEVDVRAQFHDDDPKGYNTIAEIPGTDKKGEVVMLGAHLDSWHTGTGATDNAAGSAVTMEAVRILKALDVKPRRTIRIALWSGEEQGLLGSRGYVKEHFASRPDPRPEDRDVPSFPGRAPTGPLTLKPEHAKLSAYFNLDNGTGKIRGVYLQQNAAARPIFEAWLKPFEDLGAKTLTMRNTGGTDHLAFDGVGLPGFQFIQDEGDYDTRTHHTNWDVYDRMQREDMMQSSVIMAAFVYNAAMRPELFPRKALPRDAQPAPPVAPAAAAKAAPGKDSRATSGQR